MTFNVNSLRTVVIIGIALTVSHFWAASYINLLLLLAIFAFSPKVSSSIPLLCSYVAGLALLFYRLMFEAFISPYPYSTEGLHFFIRSITIYLSISALFLRSDIFPASRIFRSLSSFSWFALILNYLGFAADISNIRFDLIFPRYSYYTGSFNGLSAGLNENGISIALFCCLRLLLKQKRANASDYVFLLLALIALSILGSGLALLLTLFIFIVTQVRFSRLTSKLLPSVLSIFSLFFVMTPLVSSIRNKLASSSVVIGSEFTSFDLFNTAGRLLSNIRYNLLSLSLDLSTLNLGYMLFGFPKFLFNFHSGGNSHHSLVGELISFGVIWGFIYIVAFSVVIFAFLKSLILCGFVSLASGLLLVLFVLSFSPSTSLLNIVYPFTFYLFGLFIMTDSCPRRHVNAQPEAAG